MNDEPRTDPTKLALFILYAEAMYLLAAGAIMAIFLSFIERKAMRQEREMVRRARCRFDVQPEQE
jgi:hypothetical protein